MDYVRSIHQETTMTLLASSSSRTAAPSSRRSRYVVLTARVALALVVLGASVPKLTGDAAMISMFDELGGGDPLRLFVGCAELAGAVGLFIPAVRHLAALGLGLLLVGAALATIAILRENPAVPAVLAVIAGFVARADHAVHAARHARA